MASQRPHIRILIIGAGSRGNQYADAILESENVIVAAIAEPIEYKRKQFCKKYIWHDREAAAEQEFDGWSQFVQYETTRRKRAAAGESTEPGVDAAFICILDELHVEAIIGLAPLGLHVMSEKPLATNLNDCLKIYNSMLLSGPQSPPGTIFGIGHVLRYSPHNMLLRELLLEDAAIGDVLSIEHTEPVGWWHFAHSYVRGNWRKESTTAPSLLTKSCHDIDLLLWLLCSSHNPNQRPHLPSRISSTGHLTYLRKGRKPAAAGNATNCLSCSYEPSCIYSAKKIYVDRHLRQGNNSWPVSIVNPEVEDLYRAQGFETASTKLLQSLSEDYDASASPAEVSKRPWFGRCVWESDNDVCDDQVVTLTWEDDPQPSSKSTSDEPLKGRMAKTATFHMIAYTEAQCHRRGHIYGTTGEITYDSKTISVYDFASGETQTHHSQQYGGGHGGGDVGLVRQFVGAVEAVKSGAMDVGEAQKVYVGCTLEDIVRSHAVVFAAEEARLGSKVVDWKDWWERNVEQSLAAAS
ncbi:MAG: hypothetical protein M1820_007403 [Bogoriella megaspora]|nr:MAG: hypothetical protein M1820_007403 [Bogoriella megaspora]